MITVTTNIDKLISSLKGDLSSLQKGGEHYNGILRQVATNTLGVMKVRIHEEGKASSGGDIGQYDKNTPLYVNPDDSPVSFQPAGKRDISYSIKTKKARTNTAKTTVFDISTRKEKKVAVKSDYTQRQTRWFSSYNEFKTFIGRNKLGKVNLSLSGQLNSQFTVQPTNDGWGLGWADKEKLERAKGFEKKYNKPIYNLTQEELENIGKSVNDYLDAIFEGTD